MTNHKPLFELFKGDCAMSQQAFSHIKGWSLFLSNYRHTLIFRNMSAHANEDALSRLPMSVKPRKILDVPQLVLAEHLDEYLVTANDIRVWTQRDPKLGRVLQHTQQGWLSAVEPELEPSSSRCLEISSYKGCIMWGTRVVIPSPGGEAVLQEHHEGHPGITRLRMYVWWPGISADIKKSVGLCKQFQKVQSSPPLTPLHPVYQTLGKASS